MIKTFVPKFLYAEMLSDEIQRQKVRFRPEYLTALATGMEKAHQQFLTKFSCVCNADGTPRYINEDPVGGSNLPVGDVGRLNIARFLYAVSLIRFPDGSSVRDFFTVYKANPATLMSLKAPASDAYSLEDAKAKTNATYTQLARTEAAQKWLVALFKMVDDVRNGWLPNGINNMLRTINDFFRANTALLQDSEYQRLTAVGSSSEDVSFSAFLIRGLAREVTSILTMFNCTSGDSPVIESPVRHSLAECLTDDTKIEQVFKDYVYTKRFLEVDEKRNNLFALQASDFEPVKRKSRFAGVQGSLNLKTVRVFTNLFLLAFYNHIALTPLANLKESNFTTFFAFRRKYRPFLSLKTKLSKPLPASCAAAVSSIPDSFSLGFDYATAVAQSTTPATTPAIEVDIVKFPTAYNTERAANQQLLDLWEEFVSEFFVECTERSLVRPVVSTRRYLHADGHPAIYRFDLHSLYAPSYQVWGATLGAGVSGTDTRLKRLDKVCVINAGMSGPRSFDDGPVQKDVYSVQEAPVDLNGSPITCSLQMNACYGSCNLSDLDVALWQRSFFHQVVVEAEDCVPEQFKYSIISLQDGYTLQPSRRYGKDDVYVMTTSARRENNGVLATADYVKDITSIKDPVTLLFTVRAWEVDPASSDIGAVYRKCLSSIGDSKTWAICRTLDPIVRRVRFPHYSEIGSPEDARIQQIFRNTQAHWILPSGFKDEAAFTADKADGALINRVILPRYAKVTFPVDIRDLPDFMILRPASSTIYYKSQAVSYFDAKGQQTSGPALTISKTQFLPCFDENLVTAEMLIDLGADPGQIGFAANVHRVQVRKHTVQFDITGPFATMPTADADSLTRFFFKDESNQIGTTFPLRKRKIGGLVDWFASADTFDMIAKMLGAMIGAVQFAYALDHSASSGAAASTLPLATTQAPFFAPNELNKLLKTRMAELHGFLDAHVKTSGLWREVGVSCTASIEDTIDAADAVVAALATDPIADVFANELSDLTRLFYGSDSRVVGSLWTFLPDPLLLTLSWREALEDSWAGFIKFQPVSLFVNSLGQPVAPIAGYMNSLDLGPALRVFNREFRRRVVEALGWV